MKTLNGSRRTHLKLIVLTGLGVSITHAAEETQRNQIEWEDQHGDPELPFEPIPIDRDKYIDALAPTMASFEPRDIDFSNSLLSEAQSWIGRSRGTAREEISRLLALFDLPFELGGKPLPFCAAGVSYISTLVYAKRALRLSDPLKYSSDKLSQFLADVDHHHFMPTPSVWQMKAVAEGKGRWEAANPAAVIPRPGWLVVFNFGKPSTHVGIVERATRSEIKTIEFNTSTADNINGGAISRRDRKYSERLIAGFIRTTDTKHKV